MTAQKRSFPVSFSISGQHSVHFICISSQVPRARSQSALVIGLVEGGGEYLPAASACGVVAGDSLGVVTPGLVAELPLLVWRLSDCRPFVSQPNPLPPVVG
jgi:hypothetical protein